MLSSGNELHSRNKVLKIEAYKMPTTLLESGCMPLSHIPAISIEPKVAAALADEIAKYNDYSELEEDNLFSAHHLRELITQAIKESPDLDKSECNNLWMMISESTERGADIFKVSSHRFKMPKKSGQLDILSLFKQLVKVQAASFADHTVLFAVRRVCEEKQVLGYVITAPDTKSLSDMVVWEITDDLELVHTPKNTMPLIEVMLLSILRTKQPVGLSEFIEMMKKSGSSTKH